MKNPVGRPTLSPEMRKTHKRVAVRPETYRKIRLISLVNDIMIVDLINTLVEEKYNDEGERI
jgi:hypothetical protein